jgi:hypothetical protein
MRRPWEQKDDDRLTKMVLDATPVPVMAKQLRRSACAVEARMQVLGLESEVVRSRPLVTQGKAAGGKIMVRLPVDLHKRFAACCQQERIAMNEVLVGMIRQYAQEKGH